MSKHHFDSVGEQIFSVMAATVVTIDDLPEEMLLEIFEKLSLFDLVVNCSKTCPEWKEIIAKHILKPNIRKFADMDGNNKMVIQENDGWTEESNATDLMFTIYGKYDCLGHTRKVFFQLHSRQNPK